LANDFDGALGAYLEAIAINPNDADYYRQAGLCAWKTGDAALAIKHLAECLARNPDDSAARDALQLAGGAPVETAPAGDSANTLALGLSADDINAEIASAAALSETSVSPGSAASSSARTGPPASADIVSRSRRLRAAIGVGAFDAPPPAAARAAYAAKLLDVGDPTGNPKARLALDETSRSAGLTNIQAARIEAQVSGRIAAFDAALKRYAELYALSLASMAAPDSVETAGMLEFLRLTAADLGLRDRVVNELQTHIRTKSIAP
jgi:tetratricopeptide (TPR) repeat protein